MKKKFITVFITCSLLFVNAVPAFANTLSYAEASVGLDDYYAYLSECSFEDEVTVAVIDSGVSDIDFLKEKLTCGYDFVDNDSDATNDTSSDSHGTLVASIIADITSSLPVKIMPVRILEDKTVQIENLISGIKYAVDNGADIINLSVGGYVSDCSGIDGAIDYACEKGVTVVIAAGNEKRDISDYCPAHNERAITVSAVDYDGSFAKKFSNFGEFIDCCAPGVDVVGFDANGMPKTISGTSFSAAYISSGAAMIKLENPGYTCDDIQEKVKSVCKDLGAEGYDFYYGCGLPQFDKLIKPCVFIENYEKYNQKQIGYFSDITFTANAVNKPESAEICWFVDGAAVGKGDTYTHKRVTEDFSVQVRITENGTVIAESETEQIYVRNSLFGRIIAYILCIFDMLPSLVQSLI